MNTRTLRTTLRTLHVLAFGAYYGGHVFQVSTERLFPALVAVVVTGGLFALFEAWSNPVWFHQLRGVCTYVKIVLLASVALFWEERVWILTFIVVLGVVAAHAPSRFRYYSVLHRRVVETHGKG
jgi:uncharacterized membrane protein